MKGYSVELSDGRCLWSDYRCSAYKVSRNASLAVGILRLHEARKTDPGAVLQLWAGDVGNYQTLRLA